MLAMGDTLQVLQCYNARMRCHLQGLDSYSASERITTVCATVFSGVDVEHDVVVAEYR